MTELIREKIRILYDFCILTTRNRKHDPNEKRIRAMLKDCKTENEVQRIVHGLIMEDYTLEQLLARKGY